ncbi:classical arabinogalactan protein 9-like [Vigna radiata var. radiata]|uniref:Classical arabinogalactan protein 9-like n=1 Tax=Vigna radiata var. radiata TaxID=3916 RepID=A0A1S3V0B8_VIGRR|nr:classical arabinogalactan protein 9-like [Vigna radiata var. radiata]
MMREGSDRPDKGKGVARPKKRQRQAPKYVLRVSTTLPTPTVHLLPSSTVHHPPTSTVHPPPTPTVHPPPCSAVHPPPTLAADPPPTPMIITPTPPPDLTSIPSSSSIPPSETATPSTDLDLAGDDDGVDPPLHDRPWIEPYGKGFLPSRVASQAITRLIKQQYLSPWPTWGAIPKDNRKPFWERFKAQALGRAIHVDEVFAQTHVRKGTNEFVDERSRKTHVSK